ncbi:unnamed protein product, partial [Musa hybrid cultivar]
DKKIELAASSSQVKWKQCRQKGSEVVAWLPTITLLYKCRLHILKVELVKDYLLMEVAFAANQERLCPYEEKNEEDCSKFDDLRESPISVRNLDELIDENHVIVLSSIRMKYYVTILSFVDKDQLVLDYAIFMHYKCFIIKDQPQQSCIYLFILQKVVTVKPCLWNGMKRLCYLFARKFYPEALHNLMQLFSNDTLI